MRLTALDYVSALCRRRHFSHLFSSRVLPAIYLDEVVRREAGLEQVGGRAAGLDHKSQASASCYAPSGCGGLPFFLGTVVAAWSGARVSMSASWRSPLALSSLLLRRVCRVVFCACGVPPPEALALWRVVEGWRLRRRSTPFLCFLGACSLGIGEALFLCL
jgi:hypothetical protein